MKSQCSLENTPKPFGILSPGMDNTVLSESKKIACNSIYPQHLIVKLLIKLTFFRLYFQLDCSTFWMLELGSETPFPKSANGLPVLETSIKHVFPPHCLFFFFFSRVYLANKAGFFSDLYMSSVCLRQENQTM